MTVGKTEVTYLLETHNEPKKFMANYIQFSDSHNMHYPDGRVFEKCLCYIEHEQFTELEFSGACDVYYQQFDGVWGDYQDITDVVVDGKLTKKDLRKPKIHATSRHPAEILKNYLTGSEQQ